MTTIKELTNRVLRTCKLPAVDDFNYFLQDTANQLVILFIENRASDLQDDTDWQDFQRELTLSTLPLKGVFRDNTLIPYNDTYTQQRGDALVYTLPSDFLRLARTYPLYDNEEETVGRAVTNDAKWRYLSDYGYNYQALFRIKRAQREFHVQRVDVELDPTNMHLSIISNAWLEENGIYSSSITSGNQQVLLDSKLLEYGAVSDLKAHLGHSDSQTFARKYDIRKANAKFDDKPIEEYKIGVQYNNPYSSNRMDRTPILERD